MPKKKRPAPKRSRTHATRPRNTWTSSQVRDMLTNPIYGHGIVLQPADLVPAAMQKFELQLANEQSKRGFSFTLQKLDQRFQSYFASLVESGSFTRGNDAPPVVDKETWLEAQQVAIGHLARGEPT